MSLMTTPKHPTSLYQNKRNLERSPYFAMKNLPLGGCQSNESPLSFLFFSILLQRKNPFFCYLYSSPYQNSHTCFSPQMISLLFVPLILRISPNHPMRAATEKASPLLFFLFSPIYITPQDLNLFPKRKILLLPFFFSSFFKSSHQKQSSQFQIPLQNLPRRVPSSLNSNGKFPCKNMKFLKLNNCMYR